MGERGRTLKKGNLMTGLFVACIRWCLGSKELVVRNQLCLFCACAVIGANRLDKMEHLLGVGVKKDVLGEMEHMLVYDYSI